MYMRKFWEKLYLRQVWFRPKEAFRQADREFAMAVNPELRCARNWRKQKKKSKMMAKKKGIKVLFLNDRNFMKAVDITYNRNHHH